MSSQPYYAVARGKEGPAIYKTWRECKENVIGFDNARYKKFNSENEAKEFIEKEKNSQPFQKHDWKNNKTILDSKNKLDRSSFKDKNKLSYNQEDSRAGPSKEKKRKTGKERGWFEANLKIDSHHGSIIVYTDGACINNGRYNAKAGIGVYWGPNHEDNLSERLKGRQTNNCAEIHAAIRAIEQAKKRGYLSLTIRTDSKFMLQSINEWVPRWKENGWKTATGQPVINKDDFIQLLNSMKGIQIRWEKVRAHCGIIGNEMADKFASDAVHK